MAVHELLIQCVGNPMAGDDGAGPAVARRLQAVGPFDRVEIRESWGEGSELIWQWAEARRAIIVDAAATDAGPGHISRFDAGKESIPRDFLYYTTHRFGVAEAIEISRKLGRLPPDLQLIAITGRNFRIGEEMSTEVLKAVDAVSAEILSIVRSMQTN